VSTTPAASRARGGQWASVAHPVPYDHAHPWPSPLAPVSASTRSPPPSAKAEWAKCVARATRSSNRDVAIKILPEAFAHDAERLARFTREAKTLASLNHPNIAAIHGLEERGGITALVMELVEGEDLSQRIARGAIPIDEALPIAKQIAEALEAAHEQGIIHRDLKPANIKVRADGTVKVLDFGLAKVIDSPAGGSPSESQSSTSATPPMTRTGMVLGTPAYMSPEQAQGKAVDKRADIWAFGAVLYETLTGTRAFTGTDAQATFVAIMRDEPDWARLPGTISPSVAVYIRRCLHKDAKQRIADIRDVRLALEGAFDSSAVPAKRTRRSAVLGWRVVATAVTLLATLALFGPRYSRHELPAEMRVDVVTPGTGSPLAFALSPDGHFIAFVASRDGARRLWLRPLDRA